MAILNLPIWVILCTIALVWAVFGFPVAVIYTGILFVIAGIPLAVVTLATQARRDNRFSRFERFIDIDAYYEGDENIRQFKNFVDVDEYYQRRRGYRTDGSSPTGPKGAGRGPSHKVRADEAARAFLNIAAMHMARQGTLYPSPAAAPSSCWDILEVSPSASVEEIKKAYRTLAMKHHPDRNGGTDKGGRFTHLNDAYHEALAFRSQS